MSQWTAIKAKPLPDFSAFISDIEPEVKKAIEPARDDFNDFIGTWDHKPTIILETERRGNKIDFFTGVKSSWVKGSKATPDDIFMFLARGTDVRYARMTNPFKAKTQKGIIKSGKGVGGRLTRTKTPQPGIDAREIEKTVRMKQKSHIIHHLRLAFIKTGKKIWG